MNILSGNRACSQTKQSLYHVKGYPSREGRGWDLFRAPLLLVT